MMEINPSNVTAIIPTRKSLPILEICLYSIAYYIPTLKNIIIIDRDSDDGSKELVEQLGYQYINLPHNPKRRFAFEHSDSLNYACGLVNTDWILLLHNDIEVISNDFWVVMNKYAEYDVAYGFIRDKEIVYSKDEICHISPQTSFILIRKQLVDEAFSNGITFAYRSEGLVRYDVFTDMWKWIVASGKKTIQIDEYNIYIHYWSYTNHRVNSYFAGKDNIAKYNEILDQIVQIKRKAISHKGLNAFPFSDKVQDLLIRTLAKNIH